MFDFFSDIGSAIFTPLYYGTSAILVAWHWLFSDVLGLDAGWSWALGIVGLTVTIRAALIPLFVKQIKSSRNMQLLQPQIKELQKKYAHDREKLTQEQMKLWKETGTNPFASCLPLILQMPIFFTLLRLIRNAARGDPRGFLTQAQSNDLKGATFLGAHIKESFMDTDDITTRVLIAIMIVIMVATQFLTQRQLMMKNMPGDALSGPYAKQQKMMLYALPFIFVFGGVAFPVGVLFYWTTSNLWTMGQQFYVIRNNPAPGTPAFEAKQQRDRKRGRVEDDEPAQVEEKPQQPGRQQPKNLSRSQRKKSGGGQSSGSGSPGQNSKQPEQPAQNAKSGSNKSGSNKSGSSKSGSKKSGSGNKKKG